MNKLLKRCRICKKLKDVSHYTKAKSTKDKLSTSCRECKRLYDRQYTLNGGLKLKKHRNKLSLDNEKNYPWKRVYRIAKQRCTNSKHDSYYRYGGRGIKFLITKEELKKLWFRDKAYAMKKPSIDRIDNDGDYTFDNCRFIELSENSKKANAKAILQYDLGGNFIKKWRSILDAANYMRCRSSSICSCLKRKTKTSMGFIWKYSYEK